MEENPNEKKDQVDDHLDHQILNKGIPMASNQQSEQVEIFDVHNHTSQQKPRKSSKLEKDTPMTQASRKGSVGVTKTVSRTTRQEEYSEIEEEY